MPSWDADQYSLFLDDRTRPARDLLARVEVAAPRRVVDVGCGPGNSTALLVSRWPGAEVAGIDSSPEMIEKARRNLPGVEFVEADLREWAPPEPVDVVYSNATLQWVEDHPRVFERLWGWVAPGGVLAVQMPANFDQPSHRLMRQLASSPRWAGKLGGVLREEPVASPATYHRMLSGPGRRVDIWATEYLQVLSGPDPVLEWVRGTAPGRCSTSSPATRPKSSSPPTPPPCGTYSPEGDGTTLFPFRRVFIVVSAR